ncbi:30S ribosomal protein S5 [Candidatus Falkowbacteria bacterium RIFCSPLOWO2_12_FULL_45_10]|uniref:Small ribosomal subunit protein uS5 n=3 Tax=Candidatus Falkowiibacteriota TaxID=1752728 RepID=A0A1F5RJV4_9BACT|nr:MAG: 30S ribosomal protein S5 [Candidatus Falkowbacteria bacterium RIFCSPHIGHO2_02_FULL_45_15]OGF19182.1 MAG: 30S ribosomal protein S5 [Candidatus Falkowbacteria bacterium RIFCSPLOWO2_12_FULL_45_10]OGF20182.1 MAG: 30S ribosomal protein S5 [Candidatus Falkowbacteria bacterium RIFCSPLOWO2_02_FULL_45_15]
MIDIARVTRVMAGGKRMRFRACLALGNRAGKVGIGLAKAADVTNAIAKAAEQAKKNMINIQLINGTIVHEIRHKFGAAKIMLKPSRQGAGIIAGGAVRIVLELAGVKNIVSKIFGTNNSVNNVQCVMEALKSLKHIAAQEESLDQKPAAANSQGAPDKTEAK